MFKKFCPQIHGICNDGYPDNGSIICSLWDSIDQQCLFVSSALASCALQKIREDLLAQQSHIAVDIEELKRQAHKDSGIQDESNK